MRYKKYHLAILVVAALALTPFVASRFVPIEFNQFLIHRLELRYLSTSDVNVYRVIRSNYSLGKNALLRFLGMNKRQPAFEKPEEVFGYIFSWLPNYAVVYPTEKFYYYSFNLNGSGEVAGNLRLADLDKGEINLAYFSINDVRAFRSLKIKNGEGIDIVKIRNNVYRVAYAGKTVTFIMSDYAHRAPEADVLTDDEKLIGRIFDESGTGLLLIYNKKANSFYEVLDEGEGMLDTFTHIADGFILGDRTKFMYFDDTGAGRKILVGIDMTNSYANNYLDGPADQVPIDINFITELTKAYPSVLLGDGTDEFGVWLNTDEWQRFALSPFALFNDPNELVKERKHCLDNKTDRSVFWTCLTKEWWNTPEWRKQIIDKLVLEGKQEVMNDLEISI